MPKRGVPVKSVSSAKSAGPRMAANFPLAAKNPNHRYTYSKHTILSTNLRLQPVRKTELPIKSNSLVERIGMGLFSRIMEMCEVVEIDGPDFRTEVRKAGVDFEEKHRDSH